MTYWRCKPERRKISTYSGFISRNKEYARQKRKFRIFLFYLKKKFQTSSVQNGVSPIKLTLYFLQMCLVLMLDFMYFYVKKYLSLSATIVKIRGTMQARMGFATQQITLAISKTHTYSHILILLSL